MIWREGRRFLDGLGCSAGNLGAAETHEYFRNFLMFLSWLEISLTSWRSLVEETSSCCGMFDQRQSAGLAETWRRDGRDVRAVSAMAGKPVKNEGGRTHLPGSGSSQLCRHGDWWPQFKPQEAQGCLPRGEQQVQVWRVRQTRCQICVFLLRQFEPVVQMR